jgi:hypothetical protein
MNKILIALCLVFILGCKKKDETYFEGNIYMSINDYNCQQSFDRRLSIFEKEGELYFGVYTKDTECKFIYKISSLRKINKNEVNFNWLYYNDNKPVFSKVELKLNDKTYKCSGISTPENELYFEGELKINNLENIPN